VLDFMVSLRPRLEVGGCHFTHVEPWLDPEDVADLWYYEGPPENDQQLERIFRAVSNRVAFCGHMHRWLVATPAGVVGWDQRSPVSLQGSRYFVIVPALYDGHLATYDTETTELVPFCLA
jgi:hypothetical protein